MLMSTHDSGNNLILKNKNLCLKHQEDPKNIALIFFKWWIGMKNIGLNLNIITAYHQSFIDLLFTKGKCNIE